jgi:apolipoprotein N-acyltransferase
MVRATNTGVTCHIDATGRTREVLEVDGSDREVQGLLIVRPAVLREPGPTLFVSTIGRGLGHIAMWATVAIMGLMAAGRVVERRRRKAAKQAATPETPGQASQA